MSGMLTKRKYFLVAGVACLLGAILTLSILVYFRSTYKVPARINLLVLGRGGPGHEGPDLTDTMMFWSLGQAGIVSLSLPRDLWYQPWQVKINSVYYYGLKKGDGLGLTKKVVTEITGQPIDHVVLIDFTVFKDLVDLVGGIDVKVDQAFDDYLYPLAGKENDPCGGDPEYKCRYEHLRFEAGWQHLDGERALKFVRSRYAEGVEGTDTARSQRQQKVIAALKTKMVSPGFILSRRNWEQLKEIFEQKIISDISPQEFPVLGLRLLTPESRQLTSVVLDGWQAGENGLIEHPAKHPSGQWVLVPKDPTWQAIHEFVNCLLDPGRKSACFPAQKPTVPNF